MQRVRPVLRRRLNRIAEKRSCKNALPRVKS
jgi:hypothetical protein